MLSGAEKIQNELGPQITIFGSYTCICEAAPVCNVKMSKKSVNLKAKFRNITQALYPLIKYCGILV